MRASRSISRPSWNTLPLSWDTHVALGAIWGCPATTLKASRAIRATAQSRTISEASPEIPGASQDHLGPPCRHLETILEPLCDPWGRLGLPWDHFESVPGNPGPPRGRPGMTLLRTTAPANRNRGAAAWLGMILEASSEHPGASWAHLGSISERFGSILEPSRDHHAAIETIWEHLGPSRGHLGAPLLSRTAPAHGIEAAGEQSGQK